MTINKDIMTFLLNTQKPGVIAFINEIDKKVAIIYRKSVINGITTFIRECNEGIHPCKELVQDFKDGKITINILETFDVISDVDLKLQHTKYVDIYKNYKQFYKHKVLKLKVRTFVDHKNMKVHVQLVNRNNDKITVGVFQNFEDAEKFVLSYYKEPIYKVVYDLSIVV